jgi:hypothetical protein
MTSLHHSRFRPQVLIILLVALGLLFAGVRVPDISRPHRPKAIQRVVLENHHKIFSDHLKQCSDVVAIVPNSVAFSAPVWFHAASPVVPPSYAAPLVFPNSGRSPPATLS